MASILELLRTRYACKEFDGRPIDGERLEAILQGARLSPSSFGMEPWRFLVVTDEGLKRELRPLCWNQKQITTCSHLIVIKNQIALVQDEEYIEAIFRRRGLDPEATKAYIQRYKDFIANQDLDCWTQKQCYIAMESILLEARAQGVDSCPIEGFERERVEELLGLDPERERVALLVALGFCAHPRPPKHRLPLHELVTYR
ncbi:MAG: NAD(P)H-dependent oxidoreductase [Nitratiruptor sp.]|nr:NAD(P)H-dependent oxidoreductase [Nitratiruptor sp.]NPA82936.1 NAD(P)H-dependent oxidoreductase [Campylobacterota bacterium]